MSPILLCIFWLLVWTRLPEVSSEAKLAISAAPLIIIAAIYLLRGSRE